MGVPKNFLWGMIGEVFAMEPRNFDLRCASLGKKARDEPSRSKISRKAHETRRKRLVSSKFFVFRQILQVGNPSFVEFRDEISWLAHHKF